MPTWLKKARAKTSLERTWSSECNLNSGVLYKNVQQLKGSAQRSDYVENDRLDRYDTMDLNDDDDFDAMDPMTRAAAERKMDRRDKRAGRGDEFGGAKGKRRSRAPAFLQSDSEESDTEINLLERRRRRNVYDEVQQADGLEGEDFEELPLEQLSDIKANSIKEWIETEAVRRTIMKEFRNFLVTYVDEDRNSVYGQRIKALGEGTRLLPS